MWVIILHFVFWDFFRIWKSRKEERTEVPFAAKKLFDLLLPYSFQNIHVLLWLRTPNILFLVVNDTWSSLEITLLLYRKVKNVNHSPPPKNVLIISTRIFPSSLTYSFMYFYTDMRIYFCKELFVAQWPGEIISGGGGLSDENCPNNTLSVKFSIY